jgi:hypothetical protein
MLIPLRGDFWMCTIITLVAVLFFRTDVGVLNKDFRLDSSEGRASRWMLSGPLAVMIGRSFFYSMAPAYYGFMLLVSGVCLTFYWGRVARKNWVRGGSRVAGLTAIAAGWLVCFVEILGASEMGNAGAVYLALLPLAAALTGHSFVSAGNGAWYQRVSAAMIVLAAVLFSHCCQATLSVSAVAIAGAVAVMVLGVLVAEKPVLVIGALSAAIGMGNLGILAFRVHSGYAWLILTVIGISILLGASLIEAKRPWKIIDNSSLWGVLKQSAS